MLQYQFVLSGILQEVAKKRNRVFVVRKQTLTARATVGQSASFASFAFQKRLFQSASLNFSLQTIWLQKLQSTVYLC